MEYIEKINKFMNNTIILYRGDLSKTWNHLLIDNIEYQHFKKLDKQLHEYHKAIFKDNDGQEKILFDRHN